MPNLRVLAAVAAASLMAAPAAAQNHAPVPAGAPPATVTYPGHWGGPFGLWYGGWQPQMVVNVPAAAPPPAGTAPWQGQGSADREGWLRECRHRLGSTGGQGPAAGGARAQDRCEAMLAAPAGAYGYGVPVMLVPVALAPAAPPQASGAPATRPCQKTVVTEEFEESVPVRSRLIPRRAPDKRVRLVPDKRVPQ